MSEMVALRVNANILKTNETGAKYPREFSAIRHVCPRDVDLAQKQGWALGKNWMKAGRAYPMEVGCYIVYKQNVGNHSHRQYAYFAVEILPGGETRMVTQKEIAAAVEAVTDPEIKAKAMSSDAYAIAVFIKQQGEAKAKVPAKPSEEGEAEALARRLVEVAGADAAAYLADALAKYL